MAKATTHPTCTPTNLNIRTRSSTLYANVPILLASILLNFRRRPESHLQLQVSEKLQEFRSCRMRRRLSGRLWMAMKNSTWLAVDSTAVFVCGHRSLTPELLQLLNSCNFHFMRE